MKEVKCSAYVVTCVYALLFLISSIAWGMDTPFRLTLKSIDSATGKLFGFFIVSATADPELVLSWKK